MAINNLPSADGTQNPWKDEVRPKINEVINEVNTHKPVDTELTEGSDNAARSGDVKEKVDSLINTSSDNAYKVGKTDFTPPTIESLTKSISDIPYSWIHSLLWWNDGHTSNSNAEYYHTDRLSVDIVNEGVIRCNSILKTDLEARIVFFDIDDNYVGYWSRGTSVLTEKTFFITRDNVPKNASTFSISMYATINTDLDSFKLELLSGTDLVNVGELNSIVQDLKHSMYDKNIVWLGTSIPTGSKSEVIINNTTYINNYPDMLAKLTGANVFNEAYGGTPLSFGDPTKIGQDSPLDIMGVAGRNWFNTISSLAMNAEEKEHIISNRAYYESILTNPQSESDETIRGFSFENRLINKYLADTPTVAKADIVILDHGINDTSLYNPTIPIENYAENERMQYMGAMNYIIRKILESNSRAQIIIVSHYSDSGVLNIPLSDLVEAQQEISEYWDIPFIRLPDKMMTFNNTQIYTRGYWDDDGLWHESGFQYTDNGDETFTTNDKGYFSTLSYSTVTNFYDPHDVVEGEDLAKTYPIGTTVYKYNRIPMLMKDNLHPHSDRSGNLNLKIAKIISKELDKIGF